MEILLECSGNATAQVMVFSFQRPVWSFQEGNFRDHDWIAVGDQAIRRNWALCSQFFCHFQEILGVKRVCSALLTTHGVMFAAGFSLSVHTGKSPGCYQLGSLALPAAELPELILLWKNPDLHCAQTSGTLTLSQVFPRGCYHLQMPAMRLSQNAGQITYLRSLWWVVQFCKGKLSFLVFIWFFVCVVCLFVSNGIKWR